jgi:hypothetical protein
MHNETFCKKWQAYINYRFKTSGENQYVLCHVGGNQYVLCRIQVSISTYCVAYRFQSVRTVSRNVPMIHRTQRGSPLLRHLLHHVLQAQVAADAADDQHGIRACVCHGALSDLHQHRKHRLLQRVAQIGCGDFPCR